MESLQQLLASLFGGDVSFFSSLWDIIQGFILVGGGVVAMVYRHRDTVSRAIAKVKTGEVDQLTQELKLVKKDVTNEVYQIKESVTYMADMLVTLSLASPVLLDKAKQQIAGYAEQIKHIQGVELEPVTQKIIEAITKAPSTQEVLKVETEKIEAESQVLNEEVKETEETVEDIINSIPL